MRYRIALTILLTGVFYLLGAQPTIGLPEIYNYTKQTYKGGAQTRKIAQDENGVIYFANDEGLLSFDGARWRRYPLPNKSLVRCLAFGPDNYLYVGGQDELGYFAPSENGILQYHTLKNRLDPAIRSFADVWDICSSADGLFFQTGNRIYRYHQNRFTAYDDADWRFMGKVGEKVVAQSSARGLLYFKQNRWVPFLSSQLATLPPDFLITSLTAVSADTTVLTTLKHGVYRLCGNVLTKWETPVLQQLQTKNISASFMVNESQLALGTNLGGCFILDKTGHLIQHVGRKEGLQNNSILTIFLDREKNLWFGLHSGIDFIPYNNAVQHINPASLNEGAGFTSLFYQNKLYLGTSVGLFSVAAGGIKDISRIRSEAIPVRNTTGEVWNLSEVDQQLLMGHNEGAFLIRDNQALALDKHRGYWNFTGTQNSAAEMVAGTYKGLAFYTYANGQFTPLATEAGKESARFVVPAADRVWFSHPYKGIYAVWLKNGRTIVKKYTPANGVASNNNNYLFRIKNTLLLTTENGIFAYHPVKDRFEPSGFYNRYLPHSPIRYMKEDPEGNIWFVFEKKIGVLDLSGQSPHVIYLPELNDKFVAGFEHINPINKNNILIGGEKGFYHINYDHYKQLKYPLQLQIRSVTATGYADSLLYGGYGVPAKHERINVRFPHHLNSLRFEFAPAVYGQFSNIEYSYLLQGFDKAWSDYNQKTEKDYTNLLPGAYVFAVKARNNLGNESAVAEYAFTILPPWYRSGWAYVLYALLTAAGIYLLYSYYHKKLLQQQRRHEAEQRQLQYLHQLELDKAEKELVQLRNSKLEAEIRIKNTELAATAMHLVQKSDVLNRIKEQMVRLKDTAAAVENTADLKKILKTLNDENKMEEQWHQFAVHFDAVHRNFLSQLKAKHPGLTPNEQKLCAYLKMNLSTKEMAQLLNISVRGVEISRYRLRKKLGVPAGMHLFNFLDAEP